MITLVKYRKFVERRLSHLVWKWNSVRNDTLGNARFYCAVVTDGLRHRILRRKCHTAEDAMRYGGRVTERVNGPVDMIQDAALYLEHAPMTH